jgi:hypothetical protein
MTFNLPSSILFLKDSVDLTDDNSELQIYSYKSCNNESSEELKKCRGLVFNKDQLVASSLGFTPEYTEKEIDSISELNLDLDNYSFFSSEEGTSLRVFFHKRWYLSTHHRLDAFNSRWGCSESFGEIFNKCVSPSFLSELNPSNVYFFLVRNTDKNRMICKEPSEYTVYHTGTLVNNLTFQLTDDIKVPKQKELFFSDKKELEDYVSNCDPFISQGVIVFRKDGSGRQFKIMNSMYQNYLRVRNNEPDLKFRYLQLWRNQDSLYNTFIKIYPEFESKKDSYHNYSLKIAKYLHNLYFKKFVNKIKIVCQKNEWAILQNVHAWFWADRTSRKVTFDVMYQKMLDDKNLRNFHYILKRFV